jgi:NAD(P)-dependent dehydrogenase (short-subunit alcohol dehydrogenase family)
MSFGRDRVVLVTGAGSGIGRATSLLFARTGARVVISDVSDEGGQETLSQITGQGGEAAFVRCDISQPEQVAALFEQTVSRYGRLDCAFNNAGIGGPAAPTGDYPLDGWQQVIGINLTGTWLCMKHELQQMHAQGRGAIVNNASILGFVGYRGSPAYVASKHGVIGLTQTAALEYAQQGIRVNAVCPGFIHTPLVDTGLEGHADLQSQLAAAHPMGRLGTPEEVASAVLWLCSDGASFVTGQTFTMDGGYLAQ